MLKVSRELWCACLVALVSDQLSKLAVLSRFKEYQIVEVIPGFFNLTLHFNPGVAFGVFADLEAPLRGWVIGGTTMLALSLLGYLSVVQYANNRIAQFALGLILGGAAGNILDRLRLGQVVDFLDFYIGKSHWPAFNLSDSMIFIGVGILLLFGGEMKSEQKEARPEPESR